jgi:cellulase
MNAQPGALHAPIEAGKNIQFQWAPTWYDSHEGPISVWLANCNGKCDTVNRTELEFFKISKVGWSPEGGPTWATGGTWATDIMMRNSLTWNVTVPRSIRPGHYVMRFEIIALQMAFAEGAEVYPACVNLDITGNGKESPTGTRAMKLYDPAEEGTFLFFGVKKIRS